jgi:AcrR family transcriptional regulator
VPQDERRRQLLALAGRLLTDQGLEQLQITELAELARVSRPLFYRLFPTRTALIRALLEDFVASTGVRLQQALLRAMPGTIEDTVTAFADAICDAIVDKGAGPWKLLDVRIADPELEQIGRRAFARLLGPWEEQLAEFVGLPRNRAANVLWIIVAAGRAALDGWINGDLKREEALADATQAVTSLLVAFSSAAARRPATPVQARRSRRLR